MHRRALILANGAAPTMGLLRSLIEGVSVVICADGGANAALALGIHPDAIVGDMDSILPATLARFADVPQQVDRDENSTDLEKAVAWTLDRGHTDITVVGGLGLRLDHTLGNLGVLARFHDRAAIRFVDEHGELVHVGRELSFEAHVGDVVSLLPLDRCEGVATAGLRYALHGEALELIQRDTTSNVVVSSPVGIRVERGNLLLYKVRAAAVAKPTGEAGPHPR